MKKRIPYVGMLIWTMIVAVLVLLDGVRWNGRRELSFCQDGCVTEDRIYLMENTEEQGILYVMDRNGSVLHVSRADDVRENSRFVKAACDGKPDRGSSDKGNLYGVVGYRKPAGDGTESEDRAVLENEAVTEYQIARFDEEGQPTGLTPGLLMDQEGVLTGFTVDQDGFYLTMVLHDGEDAGVYFVERGQLADILTGKTSEEAKTAEEKPETLALELLELISCAEGRIIVESRYEDGEFLNWLDDGSGAEYFRRQSNLETAYRLRSLTVGQMMQLRQERTMVYLEVLLGGWAVWLLLYAVLRSRNHMVYTIVIVEGVLLAVTVAGISQVSRFQAKTEAEEAERFTSYYIRTLAEEIGNPAELPLAEAEFYQGNEYDELRDRLTRFKSQDGIAELFEDICLVRTADQQVIVSASGRNGMPLTQSCQGLEIAVSRELKPDYLLIGAAKRKESATLTGDGMRNYLFGAGMFFLAGSVFSIALLLLQGSELKRLAAGMRAVAGGETEISKGRVHSRDVDVMWNSLLETGKIISRNQYTKSRTYESCYRFAPKNIEQILGKDSITEVKSGDRVELEGTLAVISTADPDGMQQELADRINHFITLTEKHQEAGGGFFVAGQSSLNRLKLLFLKESKRTVEFGASLIHELEGQQDLDVLKPAVFLHYSRYLYGVAGTTSQSFPYLLSGETEEIERYARWFQKMNVRMVVTECVKERESQEGMYRYIGYIRMPGENTGKLNLYEVLDACPIQESRLKAGTDARFQEALRLFYQHDFYLARSTFSDVLRENPTDRMAKWYLFTCEKYLNANRFDGDVCAIIRDERFIENS